jgi:N-acetylmuramoyl-L-alanine amidase CwlA
MTIKNNFSNVHTSLRNGKKPEFIVIHYTAGVTSRAGSAVNVSNYYKNSNDVSADFTVDDEDIVQYNGDIRNRYTWHCGGKKYGTKGGSFYGKCTNANSIGVEICSVNSTGKMQNANDRSYAFTPAAVANAAKLVKKIMAEYGIPADRVIRHYDVNGKPCPGIIGWNAESGSEAEWIGFKKALGNDSSVSDSPAPDSTAKYFVQVGAFSSKENAEKYLNSVKTVYPQAFIKTI